KQLSRKTTKRMSVASSSAPPAPFTKRSKGYANTVASLKPVPAITVLESAKIVQASRPTFSLSPCLHFFQAAQLMAAKRADAVLVVNEDGQLSGILTDKDIAYRVVAEGLDLRLTTVSQCMTRNPVAVLDKGPRNDALSVMVSRRFRHLPVIAAEEDEGVDAEIGSTTTTATSTNVVGLLDITKCVFERLDDLEKKVLEDANIVAAMEALERRGHLDGDQVGMVRSQHGCPDLASILSKTEADVPEVGIKASVRDAAKMMKQFHQTAVLVLGSSGAGGEDKLGGIFTTKDIVLRVIAAGLDPATTSVVRVMTPHPDSIESSASILDALKKLHAGHYLHLPVVDDHIPVGLMDVLTLTIGMLEYLMNKETGGEPAATADPSDSQQPQDGPMWNKFWNSTFNNTNGSIIETESTAESMEDFDDRQSITSAGAARQLRESMVASPTRHRAPLSISGMSNHQPHAMSETYQSPPPQQQLQQQPQPQQMAPPPPPSTLFSGPAITDPSQFGYKLRDQSTGKIHRFTSSSLQISEIYASIRLKTQSSPVGVVTYEDEEGDMILLGSNADLEEAVGMARRFGWERIVLHVGEAGGKKEVIPPVAAVSDVVVAAGAKEVVPHKRRGSVGDGSVTEFLRDAPLAVNVGISAGIVVLTAFLISRMSRS
ncbi:hypothetical protein HDU98_001378, partial [Podochytrium sp. JEL0797]